MSKSQSSSKDVDLWIMAESEFGIGFYHAVRETPTMFLCDLNAETWANDVRIFGPFTRLRRIPKAQVQLIDLDPEKIGLVIQARRRWYDDKAVQDEAERDELYPLVQEFHQKEREIKAKYKAQRAVTRRFYLDQIIELVKRRPETQG